MIQLNWYKIFGITHEIPDGRTVTPTDDIQIWLNCADIWDKTYTTLAEVLADTVTLLALITSDNAVDYMVRSTTWASGVSADSSAMTYIGQNNYCANTLLADATWCNAIANSEYFESVLNAKVPTMTDNTHPSGVASADNIYSSAFDAWRAFTGLTVSTGNLGWSPAGADSHWVQYDFGELVCIKKIQYKGGYYPANLNAVLKGSTDNITFSDILNIPNPASDTNDTMTAIIANNNLRHRYIRVDHVRENSYGYKLQFYGRKDV